MYNAKIAFVYHFGISLHISRPARLRYAFGEIGVLVALEQIRPVIFAYMLIFRPHVNPFYARVFFFDFRYGFIAQIIKTAFTAEKKSIDVFVYDKTFNRGAYFSFNLLCFLCIPVTDKTANT